jgi:hypothetical protein
MYKASVPADWRLEHSSASLAEIEIFQFNFNFKVSRQHELLREYKETLSVTGV